MSTSYKQTDNKFRMAQAKHYKLYDKLPIGTYSLRQDVYGFFFERIDNFNLPKKRYGDNAKLTDKIVSTFWDRPNSTAVLLSGQKGSGKTLQSKTISEYGLNNNLPTIVIAEPFSGTEFNLMLQQMEPAIILIDEIEKVYSQEEDQNNLLTLLDGVFPSKKLFLLTCNEPYKLPDYFFNRPGRIWYHIEYSCLSSEFVEEYAQDNLIDKSKISQLVSFAELCRNINFDMMKAIVEEMNRYNESVSDSLKYLNINLEKEFKTYNVVMLEHKHGKINISTKSVRFDLLDSSYNFSMYFTQETPFSQDEIDEKLDIDDDFTEKYQKLEKEQKTPSNSPIHNGYTEFSNENLNHISNNGKVLIFKNDEGFTLTIEEKPKKNFNFKSILRSAF